MAEIDQHTEETQGEGWTGLRWMEWSGYTAKHVCQLPWGGDNNPQVAQGTPFQGADHCFIFVPTLSVQEQRG